MGFSDNIFNLFKTRQHDNTKRDWENSQEGEDLPTLNMLTEFLEKKCFVQEKLNKKSKPIQAVTRTKPVKNSMKSFATTESSKISCPYCKGSHLIYYCEAFVKLSLNETYSELKKLKLCVNCFDRGIQNSSIILRLVKM